MREDVNTLYSFAVCGDTEAIIEYGDALLYTCPDRVSELEAEELVWMYNEAIKKHSPEAMIGLGVLYDMGTFTRHSDIMARKLYNMAYEYAEDNQLIVKASSLLLANVLETGTEEMVEEAKRKAYSAWMYGVEHVLAPLLTGDMQRKDGQYHNAYESYIVAKDLVYKNEENRRYLGDVLLRYAEIYDFGIHAKRDKEKAEKYYTEAERILKKQAEHKNGFAVRALKRMEEDRRV